MPVLTVCGACGASIPLGTPCPRHPRDLRVSRTRRGYNERWMREAARFKIEYPYCGSRPLGQRPVMSACYEANTPTPAYCVDHVRPHRGDQALFWDEEGNWQSLCASCHTAKTRAGL